jgi:hypothetical protein
MFIEKYQRQLEEDRRYQVIQGIKRGRFFEARNRLDWRETWHPEEPRIRTAQHSTDWEPGIRQNPHFTDRLSLGNPNHHVNCPDVLRNEGGSTRKLEQTKEHIVMVGSQPCKVSSEIRINGWRVSEPVREDMGKMMATEPEDEKDPKRARVVLSKGCEVVRLGYSRLIGTATKVADMWENSGNHNQVN